MLLPYIGQQVTIYGGLFLVIAGIIGNGINILIFSSVRSYRKTPCTFYFLIASIYNFVYIVINLISRVVSAGFGIDLTRTSNSWCKIRNFCLYTLALITLTCSCLATIDQFFVTSQSASLRRLSNIKWAHRIVLIMTVIWCVHGILPLVFFNIEPGVNMCVIINPGFAIYVRFYLLGLVTAIPVVIMIVFGCLVYGNIRQTEVLARQSADRQLARMILIQVVLIIVCITPYGILSAYNLITENVRKDIDRLVKESFASTILSLVPYIYYAVCLFIFYVK
jgi:hypothetical protein